MLAALLNVQFLTNGGVTPRRHPAGGSKPLGARASALCTSLPRLRSAQFERSSAIRRLLCRGPARASGLRPLRSPGNDAWRAILRRYCRNPSLTDRGVLGRAFPQAQRVFVPRFIDTQRDRDTVPADLYLIDQQHRQLQRVERRRAPRIQLRLRLRHKATACPHSCSCPAWGCRHRAVPDSTHIGGSPRL